MKTTRVLFPCVAILLFGLIGSVVAQTGGEWPQWRGANRDGISKETGLLKQWPEGGPPLVWKASGAGAGYSSFSISKGRLYTMGLRGDREFIIAFDIANGKKFGPRRTAELSATIAAMDLAARRLSTVTGFTRSAEMATFRVWI